LSGALTQVYAAADVAGRCLETSQRAGDGV
jgi:hypothetical protein